MFKDNICVFSCKGVQISVPISTRMFWEITVVSSRFFADFFFSYGSNAVFLPSFLCENIYKKMYKNVDVLLWNYAKILLGILFSI